MQPKTILLIEPDTKLREVEALLLRFFGYDVRCVATAGEAISRVKTERPDLVVTDVFAPGEGGARFLRRLADAGRGTPVLVLTAYAMDHLAASVGAAPYEILSKPCDAATLRAAVDRLAPRCPPRGRVVQARAHPIA